MTIAPQQQRAVDAALYPTATLAAPMLATLGYRVVPARDGTKIPAFKDWPNVATTDRARINEWAWDGGVCVVTGEVSDLVVLDVDVKNGAPGAATLKALIDEHGKLPETPVADTVSGGLHYWFKWPKGHKIRNDAGRKLGRGLDIRGEGGQVVAPPTARVNGSYRWHTGRAVWDVDPADMPAWMVDRIAEPLVTETPSAAVLERRSTDNPGFVDEFNRTHTWVELLSADGWTHGHTDRDGVDHWVRPGKGRREGTSATVNFAGLDCLYVYTTTIPWLESDRMYDKFGYMVHRDYEGRFNDAGRALGREKRSVTADPIHRHLLTQVGATSSNGVAPAGDSEPATGSRPIDWPKFWANETPAADFLIEPVLAAGRGTAIYSSAKAGKSLLLLDMSASAVTGRGALGQPARPPIRVVYLDLEMTEADLRERLGDLGYGPDDDLSGLAYFQATELPSLDSELGGMELADIAREHRADLVVVDTMARVVVGPENDTDTYRAFYRHTGSRLKALGIALCRLDHEGKDGSRGQRGASGKNDDVDVVYRLSADGNQLRLKRTHTRVPWIPPDLSIVRQEEPYLRHVVTTDETWPAGTAEVADLLDGLEVPLDASATTAASALKRADNGRRRVLVLAALKYRRTRP